MTPAETASGRNPRRERNLLYLGMREESDPFIQRQVEVIKGLEPYAAELNKKYLLDPNKAWQPHRYLPDMSTSNWADQITEYRQQASKTSDALRVAITGNGVTEAGTEAFQSAINRIPGVRDETGRQQGPFQQWGRGWTSEEKRHELFFLKYIDIANIDDFAAVERTIQFFARNGFATGAGNSVYGNIFFPAFQEPATKLSHFRTGELADLQGNHYFARGSKVISGDEHRHGEFYGDLGKAIFDADENAAMLIFRDLMKQGIHMPAATMDDAGTYDPAILPESRLFEDYALVTQRLGIYTMQDYSRILNSLMNRWGIAHRSVTGEAAQAQEELGRFAEKFSAIAPGLDAKSARKPLGSFSWIHGRQVVLKEEDFLLPTAILPLAA